MVRRLTLGAALGAVALAVVHAAGGVWETKLFTDWTDKDIQAVLTDSPWAGKGSLTNVRSGGQYSPVPDWKVIVAWQSALPVKQAILRQVLGGAKPTPAQEQALGTAEEGYIIRVTGIPGTYANMQVATAIGNSAELLRDGKPPLKANQGGAQRLDKDGKVIEAPAGPAGRGRALLGGAVIVNAAFLQRPGGGGGGGGGFGGFGAPKDDGTTTLLVLGFPKTDPITEADKDVEFSATIGPYFLKKKFKVKDMTVKGAPAL